MGTEEFWIRGLCFYDAGFRSFYTIDKPINKPEDLDGLKIRVMKSQTAMEMVKAMRKNVPEGGLFEKDNATEIFQEMMDMETAKSITQGPGLGIATAIYEQMAPLIESKKE